MLEAAELECERGARTLFRAVSFVLAQGELLRVAGANGSGKTSLLRILCGLARPSAGEGRWTGGRERGVGGGPRAAPRAGPAGTQAFAGTAQARGARAPAGIGGAALAPRRAVCHARCPRHLAA